MRTRRRTAAGSVTPKHRSDGGDGLRPVGAAPEPDAHGGVMVRLTGDPDG
jgi:hypothetical protein